MEKGLSERLYSKVSFVLSLVVLATMTYLGCASGPQLTPEQIAEQQRLEEARQDSIRKRNLLINWSLGRENYKNKEYDRVAKYFWKVIELDKDKQFKQVYDFLGDTYFKLQKADSAQLVYEMGIKANPDNVFLHRSLGHIFENRNMLDKAVESFETVVKLKPDSKKDWERLAALYIKQQDYEKAISAYQKLTELDPNNLDYRQTLSSLYSQTGDEEARLQSMLEVVKNDPNNTNMLYELGRYYQRQREWDKAAEYFARVVELTPDDTNTRKDLADMYMSSGMYRDALREYSELLKARPEDPEVLTDIAEVHVELGNLRKARTFARRALRYDSSFGAARIAIGQAYEKAVDNCQEKNGRKSADFFDKLVYEEAAKEYKKALKDPSVRERAEALLNSIEPVRPVQGDYFMNKGKTLKGHPCYGWIK